MGPRRGATKKRGGSVGPRAPDRMPAVARERTISEIIREQVQGFPDRPGADQVTLYAGMCVGGPFDGKPLYHGEPVCKVAMNSGKVVTWFGPPNAEIVVHEYRYADDWWVWTLT